MARTAGRIRRETWARRENLVMLLATISLLLFMGKVFGLPVAFFLVSGTSMVPTLQPGDAVIGVWPSLHDGVHVGDIVIYCLPGPIVHTSCIVHRVVSIQGAGGKVYVITKGDAVGHTDPPVPLEEIRYVVVARIPRLTVFLAAGLVGLYVLYRVYLALPLSVQRGTVALEPGAAALLMVVAFAAFNIVFLGTGTLDVTQFSFSAPRIDESIMFNTTTKLLKVAIRYEEPLQPRLPPACRWRDKPLQLLDLRSGDGWVNYTLRLPDEAIIGLWRRLSREIVPGPYPARVIGRLRVSCSLDFRYARLVSNYSLTIRFSDIQVAPGHRPGTLVIKNPNPLPINVTLLIYRQGWRLVAKKELTVPASTVYTIDTGVPHATVRVYYRFLGVKRALVIRLR